MKGICQHGGVKNKCDQCHMISRLAVADKLAGVVSEFLVLTQVSEFMSCPILGDSDSVHDVIKKLYDTVRDYESI